MNHVTLVGNVTADPEVRFANNGNPIATFTVAHNRRQKNADGTWEDGESSFIPCVAFGTLAENAGEQIRKGQRVVVTGRLQQRSWETPDGDKRSKIEVVLDSAGPDLRWAGDGGQRASRATRIEDEAPF